MIIFIYLGYLTNHSLPYLICLCWIRMWVKEVFVYLNLTVFQEICCFIHQAAKGMRVA